MTSVSRCKLRSNMSNYLMRELRTQLVSTMDSVLKSAVFEIMTIFENSLRDHQMELAQKGEEVLQLKIKLQEAEVKQRGAESGGGRGAEVGSTHVNETQREPEDVLNASGQPSDVPEIDFEVPDDWCAPLSCETTKKQEEGTCPSVRLRSLYIPLWPLPVIKQEVDKQDIDQQTKVRRRAKRGSSLNEKHNSMTNVLRDIKHEHSALKSNRRLRRRGRNLREIKQENQLKSKREERKITSVRRKSLERGLAQNDSGKSFPCKFCKKVFDTAFGRAVHVRSHKRCKGCKKEFPFPSILRSHKPSCLKLKKLLAKEAQSTNPTKPPLSDDETTPSKKLPITKEEITPFLITSGNESEPPYQKDKSTKKHFCAHCNKKFWSRSQLQDHVRVHTGEKPFSCSFCPKKFRIRQLCKNHTFRMHSEKVNSSLPNGDLAWTKPLEVSEDNRDALISPSKDADRAIAPNNVQKEGCPDMRSGERWQTMGMECSDGFKCSLCQKVLRKKGFLIEHFRTHTGEMPIKCQTCPAKFRFRGQLSVHRKQGCSLTKKTR